MKTGAAGVLSGLLFALAFPPREWVLLLPIALVPWLVVLFREESRGRALLSGLLFGLAYWCASIPWVIFVVTRFGGQPLPVGVLSLILAATICAEWPALVAWGVVACAPAGSWRRLAAFPILWVASEHARSYVYGGVPWNLTAFGLYRHPLWLQAAAVWGVYGVGFLVVTVSGLIAFAAVRRQVRWAGVAAAVVLLVGMAGALTLRTPSGPSRPLRVALLQPAISQEERLAEELDARNYLAVIEQARQAAQRKPDLIVIPESALPVYWQTSARLREDLTGLARDCGCTVLFNDIDFAEGGIHYNAARLATAAGLSGPAYRKVHLVPFGEYVPLPKIYFWVRQISTAIGEFSAAPEPTVLSAGELKIGVGVCYEILYPVLSWKQARQGANLLATISNDSWYGAAGAQAQHFAGATLRAVENRRFLVRAAITGISGIVDEKGRILAELSRDRRGTVFGTVQLFSGRTIWNSWGFALSAVADVLAAVVLLSGFLRWRKERRAKAKRP